MRRASEDALILSPEFLRECVENPGISLRMYNGLEKRRSMMNSTLCPICLMPKKHCYRVEQKMLAEMEAFPGQGIYWYWRRFSFHGQDQVSLSELFEFSMHSVSWLQGLGQGA